MHGKQVGPEPGHGPRGTGHGRGNVIQFQVEKDPDIIRAAH
jgi:hypothetical protein